MIEFDAIVLAAGSSTRAGLGYNKVLYEVNGKPLLYYSLVKFLSFDNLQKLIVVVRKEEKEKMVETINSLVSDKRIEFVEGGNARSESVYNGLVNAVSEYVLVHDGARPIISVKDITNVLDGLKDYPLVSLVSKVNDSVRRVTGTRNRVVERHNLMAMKTPQGSKTDLLLKALIRSRKENIEFTDDVSAVEFYFNINPLLIQTETNNIKVTTENDFELVNALIGFNNDYLVGQSKDTHRLESGDAITLGGVKIPCEYRIVAHSDGDALLHAITEAIIGALAKGDIGTHFPDNDDKYKDASSSIFLKNAKKMLDKAGYTIVNLDSTIYIERPMMRPYIHDMVDNISKLLEVPSYKINVKATRGEKVGDVGESKAVVAEAIVLLRRS